MAWWVTRGSGSDVGSGRQGKPGALLQVAHRVDQLGVGLLRAATVSERFDVVEVAAGPGVGQGSGSPGGGVRAPNWLN